MRLTAISTYERAPRWTISGKKETSFDTLSPGPSLHSSQHSQWSNKSMVFGQPIKTFIKKVRPSPGPFDYEPRLPKHLPGGVIARHAAVQPPSDTPGPGTYKIEPLSRFQIVAENFKFRSSRFPSLLRSPDSGTIAPQISTLRQTGGAICRVGRWQLTQSATPGPGHYSRLIDMSSHSLPAGASLKPRRSTWASDEVRARSGRSPAEGATLVISEFSP